MTGINRGLWLTAAATLAFAAGCGDMTSNTDAGNGCSTDANCATGKVCHPVLKECVTSCTGSSDCPASAKTCAKFDGTAGSTAAPGFCQCSTDPLCANAIPGNVCMAATKQCSAKCTATSGCPSGSTCNTTTGQCSGASATDAGTDAGTTTDAGTDAGVTCNPANSQPDICGHGAACTSANSCETIVDGTCGNIANAKNPSAPTMARPAFVAGTSTGGVIFNVVDEATNDDAFCGAGINAFTVTVYAYAPVGQSFSATKSGLPGFYYFNSAGAPTDAVASIRPSDYQQLDNGKMMSAKLTLCSSTATTSLQAGFAFTGGNGYCVNITR